MQPLATIIAQGAASMGRLARVRCRVGALAVLPALALVALMPADAVAKPQMIQLGLYQKAGVAWWAWKSVEQRQPDVAKVLQPLVSPLDPRKPEADVALRALVPPEVDLPVLCRRMISAGIGCLEIEAPAVTAKVEPPAIAKIEPAPVPVITEPPPAAAKVEPLPTPAKTEPPPIVVQAPAATVASLPPAASPPAPVAAPPAAPSAAAIAPVPPAVTGALRVGGYLVPRAKPSYAKIAKAPTVVPPPVPQPVVAAVPQADTVPAPPSAAPAAPPQATPAQPAAPVTMASADPAQVNIPALVLSGILPSLPNDGTIQYRPDEARTMSEIDRRTRRQGRLSAVLPGNGKFEVTPAVLTRSGINYCALTLDDGPHRTVTRRILDVLANENIKVTYFPIGKPSEVNGPIIHDFVAAGHEVGNHSLTHADLRSAPPDVQRHEIEETNRILRGFGANPVLFRPPYGRYNESLLRIAHELGMSTVLWNVDTRDWQVRDPDKIVQYVQTSAGTGSVLLLHSTYPTTASALPRVIADLRSKGCQFVTLSQWIERMRQLAEPPVIAAGTAVP